MTETIKLQTPLCRLLGVEVPIIQAPIGRISGPALAAAVSNAGGLGMLGVTFLDPDGVRASVRRTQALTASASHRDNQDPSGPGQGIGPLWLH